MTGEGFVSTAFAGTVLSIAAGIAVLFVLHKLKGKLNSRSATYAGVIYGGLKVLVIVLMVLAVLRANNKDVKAVFAGLGLFSMVLALALEDSVKDIIMGLHILTDHFFVVGDVVEIDGFIGKVDSFAIRTTKLISIIDGSRFVIDNRHISKVRRIGIFFDIDVLLPYDKQATQMQELMRRTADRIAELKGIDKALFAGTQSFEESGITYRLRCYAAPAVQPQMRRNALMVIQDCLEEADIHIPFNQLDVNLKPRD